ncbi:double-strand break repair protein AddB [Jannaschia aquimarina]|uniref:PD-(D/E)XK nuclease superfamily protein n=1 Tax=Jannaschia aquimarina TaxID=935700 RepID=A0A0D1CKY2_9RHOB|nr:double-strand break repair protein AddB [Jannaschia aquimarina]KIT15442.1 PD-(D/E)XK nuclease superfamily protein [Jannaschia aquimarina]SNT22306.1 double-strand break repair protein AddB [Jannaschia aquimarina]
MKVWYEPLGVDFTAAFVEGLRNRMVDAPPEAMAGVTVLLPTARMERRVREMFLNGGAAILPRLALVSDVSALLPTLPLPVPRSGLDLQLDLARLIDHLLERRPDLAPRGAVFDLAASLATLLREMKEEGVGADDLEKIDPGQLAVHWQDSLAFLRIAANMALDNGTCAPEDVQAICLDALEAEWNRSPPGRIIVAGSTGSRAPTARLMRMVAGLPDGAVVLPGLDTDMPDADWAGLGDDGGAQDHPQCRHQAFLASLGLDRTNLSQWSDRTPVAAARNALVSLSLRPPPVTHAWFEEAPGLVDTLPEACDGLTLVEAQSPIEEAELIALRLRAVAEDGTRAALITPDRTLSREVSALLDRWGIEPDDSAGRPSNLSPPGRLLLATARMRGLRPDSEGLVALLKHPLVHSAGARNEHLLRTRTMELGWLRGGPLHPDREGFLEWVDLEKSRIRSDPWTDWMADLLLRLEDQSPRADLATHVAEHLDLLQDLAGGSPLADAERPTGTLWDGPAGRTAREAMEELAAAAEGGDGLILGTAEYARLLTAHLSGKDVREPIQPHPGIMIWGALEARVQGADLVILGGLNDGIWPSLPAPDMWLSRAMRAACGLRSPDRTVGLSAHDFQQAISGKEVWLTRATRTADAQTVPSRWLNRLTGLLSGMGPEGQIALADMRNRAERWRAAARPLVTAQPRHLACPAPRPAPMPPPNRFGDISVTQVETLIRDPYAIYARKVLGLRELDRLRPKSDPALRGTVVHDALAQLDRIEEGEDALLDALSRQMAIHGVPGAGRRQLLRGRFARIAGEFLAEEAERRESRAGGPMQVEEWGEMPLDGLEVVLKARADRIDDRGTDVAIFDYKTGSLPTENQLAHFAKQLYLEALMVEAGAFRKLGARKVSEVAYLGVGTNLRTVKAAITPELLNDHKSGLERLIRGYTKTWAFPARLMHEHIGYASPYDHLSRYGEWDDTDVAVRIEVGR